MDNDELIKRKRDVITALKKDEDYAVEKFDTLIVSLSSGGLVFSVGFVKDVIKNFHNIDLFWLKICWICFALSLIGSIASQVTGYFSNRYERKAVRNQIKQLKGTELIDDIDIRIIITCLQTKSDRFNSSTNILNGICLFSFTLAVGTLVYFIYSNV